MNAARRGPEQRFDDILRAVEAIRRHLRRGDLEDDLVYDAVRMRTMEIGEAVTSVPEEILATEPSVPWRELWATRDRFAHRYFLDDVRYLRATVVHDLDVVEAAVRRMIERAGDGG